MIHIFESRAQAYSQTRDGLEYLSLGDNEFKQSVYVAYKFGPRKLYVIKDSFENKTGDVLIEDLPVLIAGLVLKSQLTV